MRRYLVQLIELRLRVIWLSKSFVQNFNYKIFYTKPILVIAFKKGLRNMLWTTACLTNIFRSQDNSYCRPFDYTSKPLPHHFTVLIFAFKLADLQLLTHISTLLASPLARFLPYILSHPSHTFWFRHKPIFFQLLKQCSLPSRIGKPFFSRKPFIGKAFFTQKIGGIRSLKHYSEFLCPSINQITLEFSPLCICDHCAQIELFLYKRKTRL